MWKQISTTIKSVFSSPWIWVVGIALRLYLINQPAQNYDMSTFEAWGKHLLSVGAPNFYGSIWTDYLPLPLYYLSFISQLSQFLQISFEFIFKLSICLLELGLIYLIGRQWPYKHKALVTAILLLSPAILGDSAFWGQIDTIPALSVALSTILLVSNPNSLWAAVLFGLGVAIKPIMLLAAPFLWILTLTHKTWWKLPVISALTLFITAIPFTNSLLSSPQFLLARALDQAGTYPYLTVNAWNMWMLNPDLTWLSDSLSVLGVSGQHLGLFLFGLCFMFIFLRWRRLAYQPKHIFIVLGLVFTCFYMFTTRMHERHLLFGLPFLALGAAINPIYYVPNILLTFVYTLNLYSAYYWVFHQQIWPVSPSTMSLSSWIGVLTTIYLLLTFAKKSPIQPLKIWTYRHQLFLLVILVASLLRITRLNYPNSYIFDEVYHAFTSREYLRNHIEAWEWWTTPPEGVAYEWTHPPVAKYGMVVGMLLFGENSFGWRIGSALFGIMSIVGIYFLTEQLTKSRSTALLASLLVSLEGLHIAQSRVAMNDSYMVCFYVWSLYLAVKSRWKQSAVLYGLALASKWSALYGIIPLSAVYLSQQFAYLTNPPSYLWKYFRRIYFVPFIVVITRALRLVLISLFVYVLSFAPFILAGHTWDQFVELHRQMWYYHTHLVATHDYQSTPKEWIFSARPVWYFVDYHESSTSHIYAQGNPTIMWLGLIALILQLPLILNSSLSPIFLTYFIFTLPWLFSPRIMFYYHYLPSATFLCIILASWINQLPRFLKYLMIIFSILGLATVAPMLFGLNMPNGYWQTLFNIFPAWR